MNSTVERLIDKAINDTPIIIGVYVQPSINLSGIVHPVAPLGLDKLLAISKPLVKPMNDSILPPKNKHITIITDIIDFLSFVTTLTGMLSSLVSIFSINSH